MYCMYVCMYAYISRLSSTTSICINILCMYVRMNKYKYVCATITERASPRAASLPRPDPGSANRRLERVR